MSPEHFALLVEQYCDREIADPDRRLLEAHITQKPAARAEFAAQVRIHLQYAVLLSADSPDLNRRCSELIMSSVTDPEALETQRLIEERIVTLPQPVWRRWKRSLQAIAALLTVSGVAVLLMMRPDKAPRIAELSGDVSVQRDGHVIQGIPGMRLEPSDRFSLAPGATMDVRYGTERTHLVFRDEAEVAVGSGGHGKHWELIRGSISADVARQPKETPFRITGPRGVAVVRGTKFQYSSRFASDWLAVTEGTVDFQKPSGERLTVAAGNFAPSADLAEFAQHPLIAGGALPQTVPIPLSLRRARIQGDGIWQLRGATLVQSHISDYPLVEETYGAPKCPTTAYELTTDITAAFLIELDVEVEAVKPNAWAAGFALRVSGDRGLYKLRLSSSPEQAEINFGFQEESDARPEKSLPSIGAPPLAPGVYHLRLRVDRSRNASRLTGTIWRDGEEPESRTTLATINPGPRGLDLGFETTYCRARFRNVRVSLLH